MYLRSKFQVSSIIITSFKQGVIPPPPPLQKEPLGSPYRLGLTHEIRAKFPFLSKCFLGSLLGFTLFVKERVTTFTSLLSFSQLHHSFKNMEQLSICQFFLSLFLSKMRISFFSKLIANLLHPRFYKCS